MYGEIPFRSFAGLLVLLALGLVLPHLLPEYFLYLGNTLMMYAILALGLDLLLGWSGQFAFAHTVDIDSTGKNLYVAETLTGRRIQKFVRVGAPNN